MPSPSITEVLALLTGCAPGDIPSGNGWVRMRCPFHEDRTPSASVNLDLNGFVCHSCSRRGDGLKLLQSELGLSFREAANKAEELGGVANKARPKRRPSDLLKGGAL